VFTLGRQRRFKYESMITSQMYYADMAGKYIQQQHLFPDSLELLSNLANIFPSYINLGIWTKNGELIFDSEIDTKKSKICYKDLPEIYEAIVKGSSSCIRNSNMMNEKYAYYAQNHGDYIIRTAIPYDSRIKHMLRPDIFYTGMMVLIFFLFTFIFSVYHFRFRVAIEKLKRFLDSYMQNKKFPQNITFIDSELNEIKGMFVNICNKLENNEKQMANNTNNIAHELRTPVTSIRGLLETLVEYKDISTDKKNEFMERAYNQAIRLSEIIQDVILLSKTTDASHCITLERVNIYDLIIEMLEDAEEIIKRRNATIDLKVKEDTVIKGSRTLLYSIFRNLLSNALKYAGENTTISIARYKEDEKFYYFTFYDNGEGVENKYIGYIFDRFYRIHEGRSRGKGGSGLGLTIVRDAINFHHGEIKANNRPEGGLAFLFTIRKE
jgi:signal transduction histidine kinase